MIDLGLALFIFSNVFNLTTTTTMARPKGSAHTAQLTQEQRQRIKTLYEDARFSPTEIARVTGYTKAQVRYSIRQVDTTPKFSRRGIRSKRTGEQANKREIRAVQWPPSSPDLNAIETVWSQMKDYIEDKYGDVEAPEYGQLREWVLEAWNAVDEGSLRHPSEPIPQPCQDDVLDTTRGDATK